MSELRPEDSRFMQRALELAEQGRGAVEPNPLCGAVVVQDTQVVGEGWHARFGGPHAEIVALESAGGSARDATLYVTLEPCCHHGKTPPCTDAIRDAGISRVVAALGDPYAEVAGRGFEQLRQAGIAVVASCLEPEARRLNAPYLKRLATGLPYVHAKWAMTWDGKIASSIGESKWISSLESRQHAHRLRGRMDAIVVGIGTALADDPLLTARPPGRRTPVRVVLDSHARLPDSCQLVRTARESPVLVAVSSSAPAGELKRLRDAKCEVLTLPVSTSAFAPVPIVAGSGRQDDAGTRQSDANELPGVSLESLLEELGRRRMTNVLVEGGAGVLGSLFDAKLVDEVHVFVAPKLLGGTAAKGPIGGRGWPYLASAPRVEQVEVRRLGNDLYLRGLCAAAERSEEASR